MKTDSHTSNTFVKQLPTLSSASSCVWLFPVLDLSCASNSNTALYYSIRISLVNFCFSLHSSSNLRPVTRDHVTAMNLTHPRSQRAPRVRHLRIEFRAFPTSSRKYPECIMHSLVWAMCLVTANKRGRCDNVDDRKRDSETLLDRSQARNYLAKRGAQPERNIPFYCMNSIGRLCLGIIIGDPGLHQFLFVAFFSACQRDSRGRFLCSCLWINPVDKYVCRENSERKTAPPDRVLGPTTKTVIYTASSNFRSAVSYWIAYFCISSASTKLYPTLPDLQPRNVVIYEPRFFLAGLHTREAFSVKCRFLGSPVERAISPDCSGLMDSGWWIIGTAIPLIKSNASANVVNELAPVCRCDDWMDEEIACPTELQIVHETNLSQRNSRLLST